MHCNYCQNSSCKHSTHYNISNVRARFIPTYAHSPIFAEKEHLAATVRCTPTFHSTALEVSGYQPTVNQHLKKSIEQQTSTSVYRNDSKSKRQGDLNPGSQGACSHQVEWYDPAKEQLFSALTGCSRYSRERKMADLSSNPVFGGAVMLPPQHLHP
jgi:hypothetical protein